MIQAGPFIRAGPAEDAGRYHKQQPWGESPTLAQLGRPGLQTGRFIPLEVRIVPKEEQALQPVCLIEDSARYSFSLQPKLLCQTVYGVNNLSMYEVIVAGSVNIASSSVCERKKRLGRILPHRSSKCGLENGPVIYHRRCQSILLGVAHPNVYSFCHDVAALWCLVRLPPNSQYYTMPLRWPRVGLGLSGSSFTADLGSGKNRA